jgi:hypothetical protein
MHSISAVFLSLLSLSTCQRPAPPPDACYRRNDTLPACPYGGQCNPTANYTCQRACVNYQYFDNRFWCNINCAYAVTTLTGKNAANPMLCIQPTNRNGLSCASGWACYRKFGSTPPMFRSQGPVCSPDYPACDYSKAENVTESAQTNGTVASSGCSSGRTCVLDPRANMAKPLKIEDPGGICVPAHKTCIGIDYHECGEKEHCVAETRCKGRVDENCKGICVTILGPTWGTVNGTSLARRALSSFC